MVGLKVIKTDRLVSLENKEEGYKRNQTRTGTSGSDDRYAK